ncbi:Major Facilitator Superfamily protein [Anatilimnocola aggregata]|uniref:Major Facilitator Superfamily protein n=1 Tax=Anatilimnocola aggregata TaxID=2528021 RepID=A0A517YN03_9BACT|nr:MFS transporter [Anatilimnocola aggregata]QDU31616.1 Major Facilitator Superfamily protein [Anatilimnocola aggregata]
MSKSLAGDAIAPNAYRLLWAGFMAILAAGVGFAIRGGIFDNWGGEFGFTGAELGAIGAAGFTGFCFGIIIGGIVVDKVGYGWLVAAAFLFHIASAIVTFMAMAPADAASMTKEALDLAKSNANMYLTVGMFLFAIANGTLEAVANPLVATLFPNNRTHYLNILHASWPAGLILGSALGWVLDDIYKIHWKMQLALYLIPTVLYGIMFLGQSFPKSEASEKGLSIGEMFKDVGLLGGAVVCFLLALFFGDLAKAAFPPGSPIPQYIGYAIGGVLLLGIGIITKFSIGSILLFVLFITHALVGAVELGTDGWIQNITGNILSSSEGKFLFVFTSAVMFGLRFCSHFIEKKLGMSPVAILLACAVLAFIGLNLTSMASTFVMALLALTVYGVGKTFFWPTMLAVASDRFPRSGAVAISIMGGIGMMSAGLVGSKGLGYFKDRYAGEEVAKADPALFEEYKAEQASKFLVFPDAYGLDGKKLGAAKDAKPRTAEQTKVVEADIRGDRRTLVTDSAIPATMAVIYLGLLIYFKSIGGYKALKIHEDPVGIAEA